MIRLYFGKLSRYDRRAEPASVAIPFPKGRLSDPEQLRLVDEDRSLYGQKQVTARWEDGSIKWLLVHFQVDLPGNAPKALGAVIDEKRAEVPLPPQRVQVTETDGEVVINTGPLELKVQRRGFDLFHEVSLEGQMLWPPGFMSGFYLVERDGARYTTADDGAKITVEESGPLKGIVTVDGKHRNREGTFLYYRTRITAYAGKPYVEVEYQFINREKTPKIFLKEIGLRLQTEPEGEPRLAMGEGYYGTRIEKGSKILEKCLNADTILWQSNEHIEECYYGDFWTDFVDDRRGIAVSIYQAHQNFPKALRVDRQGITVSLFPSTEEPIEILQGVAKTHRLMFHFHRPSVDLNEVSVRSLQFQLPDQPTMPESWYAEAGVWPEEIFPQKLCNRMELLLIDMIDRRSKGLGMLSFGDGPGAGYTEQGRGRGEIVWMNNEYDPPHTLYMQYARTGERRFRSIAEAAAQHWIDVDFCHYSEDLLREGAHIAHSARHATGGVTPSHQWVEGLIDYYHFTGKRESLEKALAIGENIIRHMQLERYQRLGEYQARDTGWALLALLALYRETYNKRYLEMSKEIVEEFLRWGEKLGVFLAPYTSHTQVRVPFMITIALNSLMRYYWITKDERVRNLILKQTDDLIENARMRGGIVYYKELPSLQGRSATPHLLETLAYAYRLSGDQRYLKIGFHQLQYMLDRGLVSLARGGLLGRKEIRGDSIVKGYGAAEGPGFAFASSFIPLVTFYCVASETGLMNTIDYK